MSAPGVVILLRLEAAPIVLIDAMTEGQALRLDEWLVAHPEYADLVKRARELEARKRAA